MKNILLAIVITAALYTLWFAGNYPKAFYYVDLAYSYLDKAMTSVEGNVAAVLLHQPVTVAQLQTTYNAPAKKIRILLVPGHEPDFGGAEYRDLRERNMTVDLANDLQQLLNNDGHYDVIVTRDKEAWNPVFLDYFKNNWDSIIAYFKDNKQANQHLIAIGQVQKPTELVYHNSAQPDVALRLYGINKWETENDIDIAIHIHFNDTPRDDDSVPGQYSGFTIYVPEHQYANSSTTQVIANKVFDRLAKYTAVSSLPDESAGVVEDPDLIALGAYNTTNSASMLIEYGYIYEPQFSDPTVQASTLKDLAFQTYLGLQDFFGSSWNVQGNLASAYGTLMLPHTWTGQISSTKGDKQDILSLQTALMVDGDYPSGGNTLNDCPRTGKVGPCTLGALAAFQKKYGITGEDGVVGQKTIDLLNQKYSVKAI